MKLNLNSIVFTKRDLSYKMLPLKMKTSETPLLNTPSPRSVVDAPRSLKKKMMRRRITMRTISALLMNNLGPRSVADALQLLKRRRITIRTISALSINPSPRSVVDPPLLFQRKMTNLEKA